MNIRQEIVEGIKSETTPIYYHFKGKKKFLKNKKIKFLIRPIVSADIISKPIIRDAIKEMSVGQTIEEASRIAAERFKKMFVSMDRDSAFKLLIEKGVEYPKIVDHEIGLKDDEVPFSLLNTDMKIFILKNLIRISPIFGG